MSDDLVLVVGGKRWGGWTSVRVQRGIELMPANFSLELTELLPAAGDKIDVRPGDDCKIMLGNFVVLTGWVDRYSAEISPTSHNVRIAGRSKSADLVDCSAEWNTGQVASTDVADLARKLSAPYGITVSTTAADLPAVPQFNVMLTETPYEIIERAARYSQVLAYDDENGNIVIAKVGAASAAGGLEEGVNVQAASVDLTADQRFALYEVIPMGVDTFVGKESILSSARRAKDPGIREARHKVIISEQITIGGVDMAQRRADWEAKRRWGRSQCVRLVTSTWLDGGGKPWTPNTRVKLHLPSLKIVRVEWILSEVTYSRDGGSGTTASLILMPARAFEVAGELLSLYDSQLTNAVAPDTPGAFGPAPRGDG